MVAAKPYGIRLMILTRQLQMVYIFMLLLTRKVKRKQGRSQLSDESYLFKSSK